MYIADMRGVRPLATSQHAHKLLVVHGSLHSISISSCGTMMYLLTLTYMFPASETHTAAPVCENS